MNNFFQTISQVSIKSFITILSEWQTEFIVFVFLCMLLLTIIDFKSYDNDHKDFKSAIVSVGVLGTFVGIFFGLWNFDSANISASVPKLLDGLKTAFLTSIFGMFFAVILSIVQKYKGGDAEDEIVVLNKINKKFDSFDEQFKNINSNLEGISQLNTKLNVTNDNIKELSTNILSIKNELKVNQQQLFDFLKEKLKTIDDSLKKAVETLAKGATEEIIRALENVISDFNKNLTEQFGENFKQLNEAVLNMIKWQGNYKESIIKFEQSLKETIANTELNNKNTIELISKSFNDFMKVNQTAIGKAIDSIETTTKIISEQLKQYKQTLSYTLEITSENTKQIKSITDNYEKISLISRDLQDVIKTNQNQIQSLEKHLESLAKIGKDASGITKELADFSKNIQGSISEQSSSITTLTEEIEQKLPRALEALEQTLTTLTNKFADNYQEFLDSIRDINENSQKNNE